VYYIRIATKTFFAITLLSLTLSCSQKDFDPDDPADAFAAAREPYDDQLYDIAIQKLGSFRARFPYSKHTPLAELLSANSHFELGNYGESAVAYKQFVQLHPNHPEASFAMYRIGESYWIEAPEEIDREQEFTKKAIEEWEVLLVSYPKGKYADLAKQKIQQGQRRIAESIDFIGKFYCKQEIFHACAYRSIELIELYPQFKDLRAAALKRAAISFRRMAKQKKEDPSNDSNIYFKALNDKQLIEKAETFEKLSQK
jgi:outer membrane protein assembly factor BamD